MPGCSSNSLAVETEVPLAPFTTLGIGGPARFFLRADVDTNIINGLRFAAERSLPVLVLGGGSNLLISDDGFDGLVIQIALDRSAHRPTETEGREGGDEHGSKRRIKAGAGENWDDFVEFCVSNDLAGVECMSGIPGSVGGTPVQNVGAYGQEVSEVIDSVRCIDRGTLEPVTLSNEECGFSYRRSIFNSTGSGRYIVCEVTYELERGGLPSLAYKDLIEYFGDRKPTLSETRDAVLAIRRKKSMVIDPADPNSRSAGSFFKNPVLSQDEYDRIAKRENIHLPKFPMSGGRVKIPAAWLIEQAGYYRGYQMGRAAISENHSLALVNLGGATASEIVELSRNIRSAVKERFNIELVPEPVFVGFRDGW